MNVQARNDIRVASVWISWLNAVAGIWLLFSPWALGYRGTARINDIVLGIVIGVFATARAFFPSPRTAWVSWLNAICGAWLVVSAFVLGYGGSRRVDDLVVGILVLALSVWSAVASGRQASI